MITGPSSYWIQDDSLLQEVDEEVRILRAAQWGANFFGAGKGVAGGRSRGHVSLLRSVARSVLVPDAYIGWSLPAHRLATSELKSGSYDAVYTTSSPDSTHLVGLALRRKFGLPWIADFRDPWTERMSYAPPTPLHHRLHRTLERRVLENADTILVTSPETRDCFLKLAPALDPGRVRVLTNGFDEEDFLGCETAAARPPRENAPILHAGQLNPERPLDPFLIGLSRFLEIQPDRAAEVRTLFLGAHYEEDRELVRRHGLAEHVVFSGNCPHRESVEALCRARVLLLLEQDSDRGRLILPGKVFEYLRAGRPILGIVPKGGAADHLIRETGAGRVADPSRPDEIAEAIDLLLDRSDFEPATVQRFERRELTRELARALDQSVTGVSK